MFRGLLDPGEQLFFLYFFRSSSLIFQEKGENSQGTSKHES